MHLSIQSRTPYERLELSDEVKGRTRTHKHQAKQKSKTHKSRTLLFTVYFLSCCAGLSCLPWTLCPMVAFG